MKSAKVIVKSPDTGTPLSVDGIDTLAEAEAEALGDTLALAEAEAVGEASPADPDAVKAGADAPTAAVIAKLRVML